MYKSPILKKAVEMLYTTFPWHTAVKLPWFRGATDRGYATCPPISFVAFAASTYHNVLDSLISGTEEIVPFSEVGYCQVYNDLYQLIEDDSAHPIFGETIHNNLQSLIVNITLGFFLTRWGWDSAPKSLNVAMEAMNIAEERSGIMSTKAAFGSISTLLMAIRSSMINNQDYVELGLYCAEICEVLDWGMNGKRLDELGQSLGKTINQLTTTVAEIRRKNDKKTIAAWKSDLNKILHVFNTKLAMNTHVMVTTILDDVLRIREEIGNKACSAQTSIPPGELPPLPPRACFRHDELIEKVIGFTQNLTPIALIGASGISKTSIALTVFHDKHIKEQFGNNHWFIRCDQFPASCPHFLSQLSAVIGTEMSIILGNVESILNPQAADAQWIDGVVEELSQINNICLCITSHISAIPPNYKSLEIPTLSMEAVQDVFYHIYENSGQSNSANNILRQLDFHLLLITLLAMVAHHNKWDTNRLAKEWEKQQTGVLRAQHNKSLTATIKLSLISPMFLKLGHDARDLLDVITFFPQGVNKDNLDWLFPTISDKENMLDKFCLLSLMYRSNGF
ncbi:hypothetical protein BDM02DRAFT_3193750, partial [Thelephora ganbajun]